MDHWDDEKQTNRERAAEIKARREKNPDHYKKPAPSKVKQLDKYYKEYLGKQFESRAHKVLDTWFKNRETQQNFATGKSEIPTAAERKAALEKQQNKKIKVDEAEDLTNAVPQDTVNYDKGKKNTAADLTKKKKVVGYDDAKDRAILAKEAVDKEHPIYKEYQSLKQHNIKDLRDMIKRQHRIIDTSEFRTKEHAISHILNNKHGNKRVVAALGEEVIAEQGPGEVKSHKYTMASKKPARVSSTVADAKDTNHRQLNNLVHGREGGVHASERTFRKEDTDMLQGHGIGELVICKKTHRVGTVQGIEGNQYTVVYGDGSTETGPADYWSCSCGESWETETKKKQLRQALDRHTEKALAANKAGDDEAVRVHQQYMNKIKGQMAKLARNESVEDIFDATANQLDEISKATLGSYVNKASDDKSVRAMMAISAGTGSDAQKSYTKDMAKRTKGIKTAVSKLTKEEAELAEAWNVNNRNPQRGIQVGHKVRSYDFPGMHDDHYIEGHVVGETPSSYHIKVNKVVRHNKEIPIPAHMGHVEAPKGKSLWTDAYAVHKIMAKQEAVAAPKEEPKGGAKSFSKVYGSRLKKGTKV